MKNVKLFFVSLFAMLFAGGAMAITAPANTNGGLYNALVTNVLNGEIGYVVSIALVAFGVFMIFRSAAMGVLSLAAAIIFWNAEAILTNVLGFVI